METTRVAAITDLLTQAEAAHGTYEATELNGVYDQDWAGWYAAYAVDHGLGDLLGHEVAPDQLARFLASSYAEFEMTDPRPGDSWAPYVARRITEEL